MSEWKPYVLFNKYVIKIWFVSIIYNPVLESWLQVGIKIQYRGPDRWLVFIVKINEKSQQI